MAGLVAHVAKGDADSPALARLADLQERIRGAERRAIEIREQMHAIDAREVGSDEVATVLARFDPLWNSLTPREQCRVVQLLIERVEYDGNRGKVSVTFHPTAWGIWGGGPNNGRSWHAERVHHRGRPALRAARSGPRRVLNTGPAPRPDGRLPRIARLMALAIRFERLIQAGEIADYAELARLGQVSAPV